MNTNDKQEQIARYTDEVMTEDERKQFAAEIASDSNLAHEVSLEQSISQILRADASELNEAIAFNAVPGAPLLERFAATLTPASNRSMLYFLFGALLLIIGAAAFYLSSYSDHSGTTPIQHVQPSVARPSIQETPQVVTPPTDASPSTNATAPSTDVHQKPSQPVDLDKGMEPPKTFDDKRGHIDKLDK